MQHKSSRYCLNRHTIIHVYGSDASKFLQGQCTLDVVAMQNQSAALSAICNEKGRVVTLFYLLKDVDAFYLIVPANLYETTWALLKKYAPFHRKCQLAHLNDRLTYFSVDSTASESDTTSFAWASHGWFYFKDASIATEDHADDDAWHLSQIRQGYPRLHPETSLQLLPQELGLTAHHAVSFTKGCFTGQAIIARVHYRSDRQYYLLLADIKTKQSALALLTEWQGAHSKQSLTVIDAIPTQNQRHLALCYSTHEWSGLESPLVNELGECVAITSLNLTHARETP